MTNFNIQTFTGSIQNQTIQFINARDLHSTLKVKRDFSTWIKDRIKDYGFVENEDYTCSPILGSGENQGLRAFWGGNNRIDYHITLDMAKELCMLERSELGQQARRYFIRMEKIARQQQAFAIPSYLRKPTPLPQANPQQVLVDKDRYIELLESENHQLKQNKGQLAHPRKGLRLNATEKAEIRQLYQQGLSQAAIARQVKRSETAVRSAIKG